MEPVLEGLLPLEDGKTVADMIFELANWHALAKLRVHHDVTLENLQHATHHLYSTIQRFAETTAKQAVPELPSETNARVRRAQSKPGGAKPGAGTRRLVSFNVMNTVKYHSLGDYVDYIKRSGPTDNFTAEVVRMRCSLHLELYVLTHLSRASLNISTPRRYTRLPTKSTTSVK